MGIHHLHSFIQKRCNEAIRLISLQELSGKRIVIDTSIYMYKFASQGHLIEGMYNMIIILFYYNIVPIFVFDGKPTDNKMELLNERHKKKRASKYEYYKLREQLIENGATEDDLRTNENLNKYKRESTRINATMIDEVKKLMTLMGVSYYQAEHEADSICAYLEKNAEYEIWGCLSEDTDMFVYGCTRILRYISLINHTIIVYEQNKILEKLNMTQTNFIDMCIGVGSDYNIENKLSVYKVYSMFNEYKVYKKKLNGRKLTNTKSKKGKKGAKYKKRQKILTFMQWMVKKGEVSIEREDYGNIMDIYMLKNIRNVILSTNNEKDNEKLKEFLRIYNFIFV